MSCINFAALQAALSDHPCHHHAVHPCARCRLVHLCSPRLRRFSMASQSNHGFPSKG